VALEWHLLMVLLMALTFGITYGITYGIAYGIFVVWLSAQQIQNLPSWRRNKENKELCPHAVHIGILKNLFCKQPGIKHHK